MLYRRDAMLRLGSVGCGAFAATTDGDGANSGTGGKEVGSLLHFLFMWGGQPQQDMWDMKPDAPEGIRSPFKAIATTVSGITLSDQMPQTARQADKLAIIRSLTHSTTDHGVSVYHTMTGRAMSPPRTFPSNGRTRSDFPSIASMFSYLGEKSPIPASFSIPRPVAHDGLYYAGTHAGFLGSTHDPVELGEVFNHVQTGPRPDPEKQNFR